MKLRDYQQTLIERARAAFKAGKRRPLLVSPTGSGKTVMFSYMAGEAAKRGTKTLILAHRTELLDQISATLQRDTIGHGFIAAGREAAPKWAVQVGGVASVVKRLDKITPPDFIVLDEAHHAVAGSWQRILEAFPEARVLGVTATPCRLDGRGLGDAFDDLIRGPEVSDLIAGGFLAPPKYFAPPNNLDASRWRTVAGDFNTKDMEEDVRTITGDVVKHWRTYANDLPSIAFCVSVDHAVVMAAAFRSDGVKAETLHGNLHPDERRARVAGLASGEIRILTTCELVSEGFDLPAVGCGIMARPTKSVSLWLQQVGRTLRPAPGKTHSIILDHVGNTLRLGLAEQFREWTLDAKKKRSKRDSEPEIEIRTCKKCFACFGPEADHCPQCGAEVEKKARKPLEEVGGELQEITAEQLETIRRDKKNELKAARDLPSLIALGKQRGYKNPAFWAGKIMEGRKLWARERNQQFQKKSS